MRAGQLRERFRFEKRVTAEDGYGTTVGDWAPQFEEPAHLEMRVGGEAIQAARLAGQQPASLFVRASSRTRQVKEEWRAIDARTGDVWNIRSVTPSEKRDFIEFLVQRGVASG